MLFLQTAHIRAKHQTVREEPDPVRVQRNEVVPVRRKLLCMNEADRKIGRQALEVVALPKKIPPGGVEKQIGSWRNGWLNGKNDASWACPPTTKI